MSKFTAWMGSEGKTCGHTHSKIAHASGCARKMGGGEVRQVETKADLENFDLEAGPGVKVDDSQLPAETGPAPKDAATKSDFSVPKRFDMLTKITDMVIEGHQRAELVVGCGGTGKTKTIMDLIKAKGLKEMDVVPTGEEEEEIDQVSDGAFIKVSGATSPTGLYRVLYENADATIVMDDCDGFLANDNAVNILKAVLDTTGDGVVTWNSPAIRKMDLPTSFQFRGKMIFISNKKINQVPQPLLSRALVLDMDMDNKEIVERARMLGADLLPKLSETQRDELFDFVEENAGRLRDVSLRTFVLAEPYIAAGFEDWKDMVLFSA